MEYLPVPYKPISKEKSESSPAAAPPATYGILRKLSYGVCLLFAAATLLYSAIAAADDMTQEGGALDYIINDVFGGVDSHERHDPVASLLLQNFGADVKDEASSQPLTPPITTVTDNSPQLQPEKPPQSALTLEQLYEFDFDAVPRSENAIVPIDLSVSELRINNETDYVVNTSKFGSPELYSIGDEPLVLILHTHATEAFSSEGSISYTDQTNIPRSNDPQQSIVAVGALMAETLNAQGIPTLHCDVLHDLQSYKDSYTRSAETIQKYLKEYPSIKYVFDVHRDSIISSDGTKYRPVTLDQNEITAQVMIVVGSDARGADHPSWQENMKLALELEEHLLSNVPGIARAINLRSSSFNQQYSSGSLLLEIGSCGNTLDEAKKAGETVALSLAKIIKGGEK